MAEGKAPSVAAGQAQEPTVLVVAALDPSGGAGLLADADAIRAAGARPLLCAAAFTVQTTRAARGFYPVPGDAVRDQVVALAEEERIDAVKLGMLGTPEVAGVLGALAASGPLAKVPWVVDPVLRASSGAELIEGGAGGYEPLLRRGAVLTPNLAEAGALLGRIPPTTQEEMREAALALLALGAGAVLLKGGHLEDAAWDLLVGGGVGVGGERGFAGERIPGDRRGTGCRLASFLAGRLAAGETLEHAVGQAKEAVAHYLREGKLPSPPPRA
jgi:hydroxymethylpyrimidine/phosphomethylpyrimidine kinase